MADTQVVTETPGAEFGTEELALPANLALTGDLPQDKPERASQETTPQAKETPKEKPEADDFESRYASDKAFKKFVDARANQLFQKQRDKEAKRNRLAAAVEDSTGQKAIEAAREELEELEAEEEEEGAVPASENRRVYSERVGPFLQHLATDPEFSAHYAAFFKAEGRAKIDAELNKDAAGASRWIFSEVTKRKVAAESKGTVSKLSEARATEKVSRALADVPVPPHGEGSVATVYRNQRELERAYNADKIDYFTFKAMRERLPY